MKRDIEFLEKTIKENTESYHSVQGKGVQVQHSKLKKPAIDRIGHVASKEY